MLNIMEDVNQRVEQAVIRGDTVKLGDMVRWMSGGTWTGIVKAIRPHRSSVDGYRSIWHDVFLQACDGKSFWLNEVECYGMTLATDEHVKLSRPVDGFPPADYKK